MLWCCVNHTGNATSFGGRRLATLGMVIALLGPWASRAEEPVGGEPDPAATRPAVLGRLLHPSVEGSRQLILVRRTVPLPPPGPFRPDDLGLNLPPNRIFALVDSESSNPIGGRVLWAEYAHISTWGTPWPEWACAATWHPERKRFYVVWLEKSPQMWWIVRLSEVDPDKGSVPYPAEFEYADRPKWPERSKPFAELPKLEVGSERRGSLARMTLTAEPDGILIGFHRDRRPPVVYLRFRFDGKAWAWVTIEEQPIKPGG